MTPWTTCSASQTQTRRRGVDADASYGGMACPHVLEERECTITGTEPLTNYSFSTSDPSSCPHHITRSFASQHKCLAFSAE